MKFVSFSFLFVNHWEILRYNSLSTKTLSGTTFSTILTLYSPTLATLISNEIYLILFSTLVYSGRIKELYNARDMSYLVLAEIPLEIQMESARYVCTRVQTFAPVDDLMRRHLHAISIELVRV